MEDIKRELERAVKVIFGVDMEVEVTMAEGQKFSDGRKVDLASNIAMKLAKKVGRPPREVAEEILRGFSLEDFAGEVAGPGFLNFIASDGYFTRILGELADNFDNFISCSEYITEKGPMTIVCEFSDPNPFKVLHVGHLYTSMVGDSISRLFEYGGAKVVRANFGGDVGMHVAKTLYALMKKKTEELPEKADAAAELLAENYVEGTRLYEEDAAAKEKITELNREIYHINTEEVKKGEVARLYWWGREMSYRYFEEFYRRIGVEFDKYYPESTVAGKGMEMVRKETKVYRESEGAIVFRGEEYGLHTRVFINKEGLPTYETKDVGLLFTKWEDFAFDKSVVITGNEQKDYMAVVLKSVSLYAPELVDRSVHLTHGMVRLPGNEKMSSRKGNFLRATEVIEMVRGALGEGADERLVMAAIRYAFLRYKMGGDIEFDVSSSVATNGNSGIYLEYALVRGRKILSKVRERADATGSLLSGVQSPAHLHGELPPEQPASRSEHTSKEQNSACVRPRVATLDEVERDLLRKMSEYREVLIEAMREMAPNKICNYLYELAQEFSRFYEGAKVVGDERESVRGRMVQGYVQILEHGMKMLGIEPVKEM